MLPEPMGREREREGVREGERPAQEVHADISNPPISSSLIISAPLMAASKLETSSAQYDTIRVTHTRTHTHQSCRLSVRSVVLKSLN